VKFRLFQGELEEEPGLPMTSLIDIVFLLLIFYISVSRIQQIDSQIAIKIPTAKSAETPQRTIGDVVVNVLENGQAVVNSQPLGFADLETKLRQLASLFPGQSVIIRSDSRARWEDVVTVLDACTSADIWNIKFAVAQEKEPPR
jgi:biopolymer transport protein ExbD